MTKTKKKTKVSVLSRLRKPQMMIAMVFVLGFGGFGVYKLAFSSAAEIQINTVPQVTRAKDQVASQYNVGKLISSRGSSYWQTSKPSGDTSNITNWRSKVAYQGVTVGKYKICYNFVTNKPADIRFTLSTWRVGFGSSQEYIQNNISSNRYQATCHVFDQTFENPTLSVSTELQILNNATLDITSSTVYKL
ncbi:hypothetical protein HYS01_04395 [Candidatus Saccharibacteria bacterium]|nr:hypothetical protein [Candidatus Saccharibacteria bacterium]